MIFLTHLMLCATSLIVGFDGCVRAHSGSCWQTRWAPPVLATTAVGLLLAPMAWQLQVCPALVAGEIIVLAVQMAINRPWFLSPCGQKHG